MRIFKDHLRAIRKTKHATQKDAASAAGVTERNYQDWEYGNTKPGFDALIALADYFDVPTDYLLCRGIFVHWDEPGVIEAVRGVLLKLIEFYHLESPSLFAEIMDDHQLISVASGLIKSIHVSGSKVDVELAVF